jgi:endonuclease/exonuclease/phosphatase family metal-dependent hydrolase
MLLTYARSAVLPFHLSCIILLVQAANCSCVLAQASAEPARELVPVKQDGCLRIATFNVSLNRGEAGQLSAELQSESPSARAVAAVIRTVRPDILLVNELDFSDTTDNAELFESRFLAVEESDALGNPAWPMKFVFSSTVNTGVASGLDLNGNGQLSEPDDAWGYGRFPGQYGMAVFSRYELELEDVHSFQNFAWSAMPGALRPYPEVGAPSFYPDAIWKKLRLSSKSFWDVPIATPLGRLHVLASHPTPPAFDGPEDRNGCRNHDEIKLIQAYIESQAFLVDDQGKRAGLAADDAFVVLGDLNSDPLDGGSKPQAIASLLRHPRVAQFPAPQSRGGEAAAREQGRANATHLGDPSQDTGDFSDRDVGNLRVDYALPSANFEVVRSGVFWPTMDEVPAELRSAVKASLSASDHHLVWIDICPK